MASAPLLAVLSIAGGVVSAIGTAQAAAAQADAADFNAKVAERNRQITLQQADAAALAKSRENRRQLSAIRAAYGASGLGLAGSPLDVLSDTAVEQELDVANIRYEGKVRAAGYTDDAMLSRMEARSARKAGRIGVVSSLLGGATQAGETLYRAA